MAGNVRLRGDAGLIVALASGKTVEAAARDVRLSERTVYRRLDDRAFRVQVAEARGQMVERALGVLSVTAATAAITLGRLLTVEDDRVRLGAAKAVLELAAKLRETVELETRVAALETLQQQPPGPLRRIG